MGSPNMAEDGGGPRIGQSDIAVKIEKDKICNVCIPFALCY